VTIERDALFATFCKATGRALDPATDVAAYVRALRDVQPEDLARSLPTLSPVVGKRCRHVVSENVRVHDTL
jgi:galactokinase